MPNLPQPVALIQAKGRKHLSKAEIQDREAREVQPCPDGIKPPEWLTAEQRARFDDIAARLMTIKVIGETDCDALARYVVAQELYEITTAKVRTALIEGADLQYLQKVSKLQERYFAQAHACARELALTITSRSRIQVPAPQKDETPNKFSEFMQDDESG